MGRRGLRAAARAVVCALAAGTCHASAEAGFPLNLNQGETCAAPADGPSKRSDAEGRLRLAVDGLLARLWGQRRGGYGLSAEEERPIVEASLAAAAASGGERPEPGKKASTYGEVTPKGVRQIGRALGTDCLSCEGPLVFMDMGSGVGKFVAQAYMEWPAVARAVGVELSPTRSAKAREAWAEGVSSGEIRAARAAALRLLTHAGRSTAKVSPETDVAFHEGDLFAEEVREVTHVYLASLCFADGMLRRVAGKLAAEAERLQAVATLRRFPADVPGLEYDGKVEAEMTWSRGASSTVHLYRRPAGGEPQRPTPLAREEATG